MLKLVTAFIISLTCLFTQAQTSIYPGNFRYISEYGPLMNYWADTNIKKAFTIILDSLLVEKRNWTLNKSNDFEFSTFKKNTSTGTKSINKYPYLNLYLIEYPSSSYLKQINVELLDSVFAKEVLSVLHLKVQIEDRNQSIFFENDLDVYVKKGSSNGIGIPINNLQFTKKGFLETLKKSFAILLDSTTTNEAIDLTVAGAFVGDNFILAKASGIPRTQVSSTKGISKFTFEGQEQLIRWGDQLYKDVVLYGKNKTIISEKLKKAFEIKIGRADTKPIFLIQEGRDIIANKNYLLQIAAHIGADPDSYFIQPLIEIIPGNYQVLLNEKDTVAVFEIQTNIIDSTKKIFLDQVTNGIDTSSIVTIDSLKKESPMKYDFFINGKLKEKDFEIKIAGDRYLREFYLNNELVCIANGNKTPERFVMLNNNISSEIMNVLFIIGFNSFFQ